MKIQIKDLEIQKKFKTINEAFLFAEKIAKSCHSLSIIQSVDNYNKTNAKIMFYVESEPGMIRIFEKEEHHWEDGKMIF